MPRGARKQFDRTEVLDKAMQLFWEKGYEGVGLSELLDRMGIGRQSLYDTFTDKRTLFLEAVDHYVDTWLSRVRDQLEAPGSPLMNVRRVLKAYEQHNTSSNGLGCMLVNSLAEFGTRGAGMTVPLRRQLQMVETIFRRTFDRAKEQGEIEAHADTRALARAMCSMVFGVCLMGRMGMSKAMVRDTVRMNSKLIDSVATNEPKGVS